MKNLVIAVSPDSSLDLLGAYADVVILDKDSVQENDAFYETVYIRSHFSQPSTLPQNFRTEIDMLVQAAKRANPDVKFIDGMDTVDAIVAFEDKWQQYVLFKDLMPRTEQLGVGSDIASFSKPIFKNRLSSRGSGVTWDVNRAQDGTQDWIIQESLDITEELRIYIVLGEVYPTGAVKQSMTGDEKAQSVSARQLTQNEVDFASRLVSIAPDLDILGIDVARTADGKLYLLEANRSPGFAKFHELTGSNLADKVYA